MRTVLDTEFKVTENAGGKLDFSPYNPSNRLVTVQWLPINEDFTLGQDECEFFYHESMDLQERALVPARRAKLQTVLDQTTLLIGHNIKIDLQWLKECGFVYDGPVFDTMICEYVMARGQDVDLTLEGTAYRHNVTLKKKDLIQPYLDDKVTFDRIPREIVDEYARGDTISTAQVYLKQRRLLAQERNRVLLPTIKMMNEYCLVLTDMERAGIMIDQGALNTIGQEYQDEKVTLEKKLNEMVFKLMGDTPVNLGSPQMLSEVIYSRAIRDKEEWKKTFNLGKDPKTGKDLRRPKMSETEFHRAIKEGTIPLFKTKAHQCPVCNGTGKIQKLKKDGTPHKNTNNCKNCVTKAYDPIKEKWVDRPTGMLYEPLKQRAGLRFNPESVEDISANGFSTDKETLTKLVEVARADGNEFAVEFLSGLIRLNAIDTYLSSFVGGIQRGLQEDGRIHPTFNQTVTATGRLSHTNPNFGNMPRGDTFPVKRAIVSRFKNGKVIDADFSGLEFVGAAELSGCPVAFNDIITGKDIHKQTASIIFEIPQEQVDKVKHRQPAKPFTFAPLYGGMGASYAAHIRKYFQEFFVIYHGIGAWHKRLEEMVAATKTVRLPSGREYFWPDAERTRWGSVSYSTQWKNYPVQGWATADCVPCCIITLWRLMKKHKVQSVIINTVHDSIVIDCHPDEIELMLKLIARSMLGLPEVIKQRYNYDMTVPLSAEIKIGDNWLDGERELSKTEVKDYYNLYEQEFALAA